MNFLPFFKNISVSIVDFRKSYWKKMKRKFEHDYEIPMNKKLLSNIREMKKIYNFLSIKWKLYQRFQKGPACYELILSNNQEDLHFNALNEIPSVYFMSVIDEDKQCYSFDIRHCLFLKNAENQYVNPYTRSFILDKYKQRINQRLIRLYELRYDLTINQTKHFSNNEKVRNKIFYVFQKLDFLDCYTDLKWFTELDKKKLIKWYFFTEDLWNYRTELSLSQQQKINPSCNSFEYKNARQLNRYSKETLQNIVLNEILKLIDNGVTRADRILGAMYVCIGLTYVSDSAKQAMPWYIPYLDNYMYVR